MNKGVKRYLKVAVSLVILLALGLGFDLDIPGVISELKEVKFLLFALVIPLFINPLISNNRWKIFLKSQGIDESIGPLMKMYYTSIFLGALLPSSTGFDAIRMYMIEKRHPNKKGAGTAAVFIERLLGFYLLSLVGVVGALWIVLGGGDFWLLVAIGLVNLGLTLLFVLVFNRRLFRTTIGIMYRFKKARKVRTFLFASFSSVHRFPLRKTLPATVPLILLFQLSTIVLAYLLFLAFGVDVPFYYHLAYMPVIQIISIIPLSIAGLGFREGAFVYFYGLLGIASGMAFTVSILYYVFLLLTPAFVGWWIYLFYPVDLKALKKEISTENSLNQ